MRDQGNPKIFAVLLEAQPNGDCHVPVINRRTRWRRPTSPQRCTYCSNRVDLIFQRLSVGDCVGSCDKAGNNRGQNGGSLDPGHVLSPCVSTARFNRAAHSLIPPFRLINRKSGSDAIFCTSAHRTALDHFDRVRLSTLAGSAVQRMIAANGSSWSVGIILRNRSALCARSRARVSANHHATSSNTAVKYM